MGAVMDVYVFARPDVDGGEADHLPELVDRRPSPYRASRDLVARGDRGGHHNAFTVTVDDVARGERHSGHDDVVALAESDGVRGSVQSLYASLASP